MAIHTCQECGKNFKQRGNRKRVYCSKECYGNAKRTNTDLEHYFGKLVSKRGRHKTLSKEDCISLWEKQNGKCAITGLPMTIIHGEGRVTTNASLDRIKAGEEYTKENVRLTCTVVNLMRLDMSDNEFADWCRKVLNGINC